MTEKLMGGLRASGKSGHGQERVYESRANGGAKTPRIAPPPEGLAESALKEQHT